MNKFSIMAAMGPYDFVKSYLVPISILLVVIVSLKIYLCQRPDEDEDGIKQKTDNINYI